MLVAAPILVQARPVAQPPVSATALLAMIRDSTDVPFTGRATSRGRVSLPAQASLEGVATLLGGSNDLRVWWSSPATWRTATVRTTGETDLLHRDGGTVRWVYESKRVTLSPDVPVRLPESADLLPNVLARRVLAGARPGEVSRIDAVRVAGRTAAGLRLTPADPQASITAVDVWADPATGVPLRVDLRSGTGPAALTSSFSEIAYERPAPSTLRFTAPADAQVSFDQTVDMAAAADRYAARDVPDRLAGLPTRALGLGSVGVYGRGPTFLLAIPLRESDAHRLRHELADRPGAACTTLGWQVATGPLRLVVPPATGAGSWLLAGTVTPRAATRAARELVAADGGRTGEDCW